MTLELEYTDTFDGEANYSWCIMKELVVKEGASDLSVIRKAKKVIGLNGVKCRKVDFGDTVALYPNGSSTVLFIVYP